METITAVSETEAEPVNSKKVHFSQERESTLTPPIYPNKIGIYC